MIAKTSIDTYIGPKAIFDENFVPSHILHRDKEINSLSSLLHDALSDSFSLNILYQGIQGIGKKVIVNKVLDNLTNESNIHRISVNCSGKTLEEIIVTLLSEVCNFNQLNLNYTTLLNSKISDLWNFFKLASKKYCKSIIIVLNNIDDLKQDVCKKFLQYSKEVNINLISTNNKILKSSELDLLSLFDFKKKLSYFSYNELYDILKQRAQLAFIHGIDKEIVEYITDLIFEHYVPVPGKGVDVIKELYPILNQDESIKSPEIMDVIQNQFDSSQLADEFSMLSYISEAELLTIIFLDNLTNYFLKNQNYYISLEDLKEIYEVSCESINYEKNFNYFKQIIQRFTGVGILNVSKKTNNSINRFTIKETLETSRFFFMVINPKQLKAIVDTIFNKF